MFSPSFYYTHTEEEIKRITAEAKARLQALIDKELVERLGGEDEIAALLEAECANGSTTQSEDTTGSGDATKSKYLSMDTLTLDVNASTLLTTHVVEYEDQDGYRYDEIEIKFGDQANFKYYKVFKLSYHKQEDSENGINI